MCLNSSVYCPQVARKINERATSLHKMRITKISAEILANYSTQLAIRYQIYFSSCLLSKNAKLAVSGWSFSKRDFPCFATLFTYYY